jgi:serine protease Do
MNAKSRTNAKRASLFLLAFAVAWFCCATTVHAQPNLNKLLQEAMKESAAKVAPSVVQIVTEGGADMVVITPKGPAFRKAMGPTTGVVVASNGYIISSAFNFINNPTGIFVSVPGMAEPVVAKKIATDRNRMVTLLKIDKTGLPVPAAVPVKDIREGQWSIALGRTLNTKREAPPSMSKGVISAVGRIWGKALQTDCKISPVNYGGPIIDIQGRVQGILIPASPQVKDDSLSMDETAGFEWYDSGIGFAIPFEEVLAILPRLKQGKDLKAVSLNGLIGPGSKNDDVLEGTVMVRQVAKDSPAARAGLKAGDQIVEVDGQPTLRMGQFRHVLGRMYDGDRVSLKFKRDGDVVELKEVELTGAAQSYAHPFLGILPMRDDPRLALEIRFVYPKSPADVAGLTAGDRIVKFGTAKKLEPFTGPKHARGQLGDFLNTLLPGNTLDLEVLRKNGKTETLSVKLGNLTQELIIPDKLEKTSLEKARDPVGKNMKAEPDTRKVEKGLKKLTMPTGEEYWVFVPDTYDSDVSHGLVVWLHLPGVNEEKDFNDFVNKWEDLCEQRNLILLFPVTQGQNGLLPGDAGFIVGEVRDALERFTIDRQRIVAHGTGIGGQMAVHLGFNNRDLFRGVVSLGAVAAHPRDNVKDQRLAFYFAGGELDPLIDHIGKSAAKLLDMNFPATYRKIAGKSREYFEERQLREVAAWIDSLDKL